MEISLNFGKEYHIIYSSKNFLVEDKNQKLLFMIFKSSQELCSIKFIEPLNPLLNQLVLSPKQTKSEKEKSFYLSNLIYIYM